MSFDASNELCLECGLCCNGVIFARGQLQPEDDPARLRALGLDLLPVPKSGSEGRKFKQPCAAFDGFSCRIYKDRPTYCRQFECLLLKSVQSGETEVPAALRQIRSARRRVKAVKRLLRELGDTDEQTALSLRFRRMQKRFDHELTDRKSTGLYGELTLAVHDLNVLLSDTFYPG
jgi:Fe-S-cluster containining protein